jgi:tRNA nucleotidyltransferase (CCA-adding enzyme)
MMKLTLTSAERRLRDILVAAANTWPRPPTTNGISTQPETLEPLIVRFAGGWVRDKLLFTYSADIDIALNIATGTQFASHVASYLTTTGADGTLKFNTISRNAEQSKHLETATAHFLDLDLDFVNLRSEAYTDSSRIPSTMAFGTPKEDAVRRDLTINSLFYNLHTESVEDLTGMGIEDIHNGIIRTPLEPMTTFLDDPLRVLRAVRFAARLNFEMTGQVKQAIMDERVRERLRKNVTVPRKADEIKKLLKGTHLLLQCSVLIQALINYALSI